MSFLHTRKGCETTGSDLWIGGSQDSQLQLGDREDRDGDLLGKGAQWPTSLLGDEDGGVRHGFHSSISAPRTSARSSSRPGSAGASSTMRRNSEEGSQGSRAST